LLTYVLFSFQARVAVVKWLAEFDNFREKRADKAEKRVRFCQVAKLHFTPDLLVSHLEEYCQSMTSKGVLWPDITGSSPEKLWSQVRMEPGAFLTKGKPCACEHCGEEFASRRQLFVHLREAAAAGRCGVDREAGYSVLDPAFDPPSSVDKVDVLRKLAFGVTYSAPLVEKAKQDPSEAEGGGAVPALLPAPKQGVALSGEIESALIRAFQARAESFETGTPHPEFAMNSTP